MGMEFHRPALEEEVLRYLALSEGQTVLDATAGGGGHAARVARIIGPSGRLVLIDQDPAAIAVAREAVAALGPEVHAVRANFRNLDVVLDDLGIAQVEGVLMDLGVSSHQLDTPERGFSFRFDAPLDMRMSPDAGTTAAEWLANVTQEQLADVLWELGDEKWARAIARTVVKARQSQPIQTTGQLAALVESAIPRRAWPPDRHPATRTFMAIRSHINDEIGALREAIHKAIGRLASGGRLVIIAWQSNEERVIKEAFRWEEGRCACPPGLPVCKCGAVRRIAVLTRKPIAPSASEIAGNPRARSARLRAAVRV